MSRDSWLTLLLSMLVSIPVGVGTALLTPIVESWLLAGRKKFVMKRRRQSLLESQRLFFYRRKPEALTQLLIVGSIRTFLVAFLLLGIIAILMVAGPGMPFRDFLLATTVFVVAGVVAVIQESRGVTDVYWRVRHFEAWFASLPEDLQKELQALPESEE